MNRHRNLTLAMLTALACTGSPRAQSAYPDKPIRLVVGYAPAGAADFVARIVGEAMGKALGQPILIDNKPGAGSTVSSSTVARAPADGYTLMLASGTLYGIDQSLYKVRYKPTDFTPITRLSSAPLVLAVNPKLGVRSLPELMAKLKANPGTWNYASSGVGGSPHIAALTFAKVAGADVAHIPFKGGAQALQAVAAGDVQMSFGTAASVMPLGKQGTVTMLGVTSAHASKVAPGVATLAAQGLKDFDFTFWFGLYGPANLPAAVTEKLFAAASSALADPAVQEKLLSSGNEAAPSRSPADFDAWATATGRSQFQRIHEAKVSVD